ncbi:TetR/AcrR family transcriptional regulator [Schleiferilactobacillus shenzhenensis]|uniref:HTH tetR-type domain-containing protein n=1 Tax=Schleiferilactobacillus shenzhenensis LY-73 TaxID=1231336 RepID=U4TR29_9LACO|nr:TetR/AcrR family transcriptional regulator [Schleiferilactobacillus shenzhenensis]ERL65910.1 hypothetical protein L248_1986 [Schleiferilactobacillus shenzhenensis LY-73]
MLKETAIIETNTKMLATEVKIQKAFVQLVGRQGFDKLSVQQLTQAAGISRGTFYLHYVDKYDLLTHYEDEIVTHVTGIFRRYPKPQTGTETAAADNAFFQLFKYLYRQRALAALLLNEQGTQTVVKVKQLIGNVLQETGPSKAKSPAVIPSDFAQEIVSQGILDIVIYWLNQPTVLPPEQAYQIFQRSRSMTPEELTRAIGPLPSA